MDFWFWFSAAVLTASMPVFLVIAMGARRLELLADTPPVLPGRAPRVSIIVPARDEQDAIETALRSMLALDYPGLEVIAIDDRSTDRTGEILDRLLAERAGQGGAALQVVHVRELPAGWLGKNHALHLGASRATGDYLLFTDADVHYEPTALRRAIALCEARGLDHVTLFPDIVTRTRFMRMSMLAGAVGFLALYRPWRSRTTGRHGLGAGAFNLVRAETYRRAGGHAVIAMEVLDDVELGRLMGDAGRQGFALGVGLVSVEMYRNAAEMFRGLQKNAFTFLGYSAWMLVVASLATLAVSAWPWIGAVVTDGSTRWINIASAAGAVAVHAAVARRVRYGLGCLVYLPVMAPMTVFLYWQVAIRTWLRGGVVWRGTFYPLAELKAARRRRHRRAH